MHNSRIVHKMNVYNPICKFGMLLVHTSAYMRRATEGRLYSMLWQDAADGAECGDSAAGEL